MASPRHKKFYQTDIIDRCWYFFAIDQIEISLAFIDFQYLPKSLYIYLYKINLWKVFMDQQLEIDKTDFFVLCSRGIFFVPTLKLQGTKKRKINEKLRQIAKQKLLIKKILE